MKLLLTLLASYIVYTNAAPVYVTKTVVVSTQYVTATVNSSPLATEATPTQPAAPVSTSTETPVLTQTTENTSSVPPAVPTTTTLSTSSSSSSSTTAAAPATTTTSTSSLSSFEASILDEHNAKRALHGANPLTWDPVLAEYAANYAANHFSCDNVELIHSGGPYGENLAAGYVGGVEPVDAWYDEISQYDYSNPGYSEATGHFTQLIWASTTAVGCAKVMCDNAWRQYTICEYNPAGNVLSLNPATRNMYFPLNVYPLIS